jgi:hypothetical protein
MEKLRQQIVLAMAAKLESGSLDVASNCMRQNCFYYK